MKEYLKLENIIKDEKLHKKLTSQIQVWYNDSDEYMSEKRKLFKEWYTKFTNPWESITDKIKINMLYQHLKAFISTYYTEWLTASFVGREFLDDDYAYMLETCYQNDIISMDKKKKDFFHILNIGFYGVSLLLKDWYDNINDTTKYKVLSPEYWLPDRHGNVVDWFRFHMFDFSITKTEIEAINKQSKTWDIYMQIDKYQPRVWNAKIVGDNKKNNRALWASDDNDVYYGTRVFFEREWVKYIADLFNNRWIIGRLERINPVTPEEEKNPSLIPYPVEVVNAFPLVDDPCGIWLAELVLSFQSAKNRLMNMALRKEEWNSWFQILLADVSKISDIDLLSERPIDWPIIVPFDWSMWALNGDVVRPLLDGIKADQSTINLANILDIEATTQTGQTATNRWLPYWPDTSLGEAKMQQVNSNLIFSLDSECISWGELWFVKNIWLRWLKEFLPNTKKKYARIGNGIASNEVMLDGKAIREHGDPDIFVESRKNISDKYKQKLDYLLAREALVMADPNIPTVSKLFYKRDIDKYRGVPREEIYLKYPRTSDEDRAIRYIKMINAYADDKNMPKPVWLFYNGMDLWTYYIYLQKARDCELKKDILSQISLLMEREWLNKAQQPQQPWQEWAWDRMEQIGNSMTSQLVSNIAQQSGTVNNYPTRADVLNP